MQTTWKKKIDWNEFSTGVLVGIAIGAGGFILFILAIFALD